MNHLLRPRNWAHHFLIIAIAKNWSLLHWNTPDIVAGYQGAKGGLKCDLKHPGK
jgi:hypothetical protein